MASMTAASLVCVDELGSERQDMLVGIQILAAANKQALAVAHAAGFSTFHLFELHRP